MLSYIGNLEKPIAPIFKIGPSLDFVFGEPKIDPSSKLNNPEGFRNNVAQGSVDNPFNFGLNASTGVICDILSTKLNLELRYNRFISDPFPNTKFQTFAISIGIQLPE
ncbi:hypothetical protein C7460_1172 [Marinoscillum furvescens DSM 4134]|uniref:Uncharacterized protein n=2 Tax=Marinoscillum furvescens TaxID=1026 RepID=A0A3D9L084_MARFU|nr:hypothetical protein C7460_1172 [Marinoscillum furvescens DSM 4134]